LASHGKTLCLFVSVCLAILASSCSDEGGRVEFQNLKFQSRFPIDDKKIEFDTVTKITDYQFVEGTNKLAQLYSYKKDYRTQHVNSNRIKSLIILDLDSGESIEINDGEFHQVTLSEDGKYAGLTILKGHDLTFWIYDLSDMSRFQIPIPNATTNIDANMPVIQEYHRTPFSVSEDGRFIVFEWFKFTRRIYLIYDRKNDELKELGQLIATHNAISAFGAKLSKDGRHIYYCNDWAGLIIWDRSEYREEVLIPASEFSRCDSSFYGISDDGRSVFLQSRSKFLLAGLDFSFYSLDNPVFNDFKFINTPPKSIGDRKYLFSIETSQGEDAVVLVDWQAIREPKLLKEWIGPRVLAYNPESSTIVTLSGSELIVFNESLGKKYGVNLISSSHTLDYNWDSFVSENLKDEIARQSEIIKNELIMGAYYQVKGNQISFVSRGIETKRIVRSFIPIGTWNPENELMEFYSNLFSKPGTIESLTAFKIFEGAAHHSIEMSEQTVWEVSLYMGQQLGKGIVLKLDVPNSRSYQFAFVQTIEGD
jgi:hypothetical protein